MQFHHHGYVSGEPRVLPAEGLGIDRPADLPDEMDVLIVGSGPAGMLLAAQMSQFPTVGTRIIERRSGRLELGQADGIQPRSVETFQAFGFAERIIAEAAAHGPGRIAPDYGVEFVGLTVHDEGEYPVEVRVNDNGTERTIRAKYVAGCDGARSGVREAIGRKHVGAMAAHAWGVMDVLVNTDFPDWRTKCAINAEAGNILHIPREGGYLSRMYIDLGAVAEGDNRQVKHTPLEVVIQKANEILHPYTLDVKQVAWHSVYEVGHRVTDGFDDAVDGDRHPRVFLTGDACHTHSAKAGQGMNVSMQDGFNLGWKLGHVLSGRAPQELLSTYGAERRPVAQQLIDFDREWSSLMARKPEEISDPQELATFYLGTAEFPSGFMTQYEPSMIVDGASQQELAAGFPLGKRFKSAEVTRVSDGNAVHLGHHATADGRWRVYAFADAEATKLTAWADAVEPVFARYTPQDGDVDAVFDVKAIYQQRHDEVEFTDAPALFRPQTGPFGLTDWEKVYSAAPTVWCHDDIFEVRELSRDGVVVVVRPDQYVAAILPLDAVGRLSEFFEGALLPAS